MGFVIAGMAVLVVVVLFLILAALSFVTSAGDDEVWGWRVFRKLGILKLLRASHVRAMRREDARLKKAAESRNANQN